MLGRMTRAAWLLTIAVVACGHRPPVSSNDDPDGDRITGARDKCPDKPETYNGFEDEDGCPDIPPASACIHRDYMVIVEKLAFATGSSEPSSHELVGVLAATLVGNPQVTRVAVVGAIADGEPETLAKARADAVVAELVRGGVAADRLESHGHAKHAGAVVWFVIRAIDGTAIAPEDDRDPLLPFDRNCARQREQRTREGRAIDCDCL
jgi:hypothetical protein